jgi:acetoin utilization deacetylase AcuC-like enzyme
VNWNLGHAAPKEFVERMRQEGRLQASSQGKEESWLCPSHPENQKLEIESMVEVVRRYGVDGIHFDYIRYPDDEHCFCAGCRQRFQRATAVAARKWPQDALPGGPARQAWLDWRRDNITAVVKAVSEQARALRPEIKLSAAVFPNWATDRDGVGQDWKLWCEKGYLDFVCPMDYTPSNRRFQNLVQQQVQWAGKVPCYPGLGVSASTSQFGVDRVIEQINITRRLATQGFIIFNYGVPESQELLPMLGLGVTAKHAVTGQGARTPPRTGLVYDAIYLKHDTGAGHPERAERLVAIRERLERTGLLPQLALIKPRVASEKSLATIHNPQYIDHIRQICRAGTGYVDSPDTPASPDSYAVALMAVGGVQSAIDAVMEGRIKNAFCAVRPPGHHALKDRAMGFCFFNNVAIAAKYIQNQHRLSKVLVVDWDVHHGNGTQASFYDDPTVFYFSAHQSPFYPGTGGADEKGEGKGLGFTLNVPLPADSGDAEYIKAFEERLKPAAAAFQPDFVLISAGFDAARDDLLGRMNLTPGGYAQLTRIVKAIAQQYCRGRLVSVLEGGYNLEALAASVEAHLRVLME